MNGLKKKAAKRGGSHQTKPRSGYDARFTWIISLHKAGKSVKEIAAEVAIHPGNVHRALKKWREDGGGKSSPPPTNVPEAEPMPLPLPPTPLPQIPPDSPPPPQPPQSTGQPESPVTKTITFSPDSLPLLDAAVLVLHKNPSNSMRPNDMVDMAIACGIWTMKAGKTPGATLWKSILSEIKRKGCRSRFAWTSPGRYGLTEFGREWVLNRQAGTADKKVGG